MIRAAAEEAYFQGSFIAQGYIGVGSETKVESVLVGMTAEDAEVPSGTAASEGQIRFWAGKPFSERYDAPTKILENGKLISDEAEIRGTIYATAGEMTNVVIRSSLESGDFQGTFEIDGNKGMAQILDQNGNFSSGWIGDSLGSFIQIGASISNRTGTYSQLRRDRLEFDYETYTSASQFETSHAEIGYNKISYETNFAGSGKRLVAYLNIQGQKYPGSYNGGTPYLEVNFSALPQGSTGDSNIQSLPDGTLFIDTGQRSNNCFMLRIKDAGI